MQKLRRVLSSVVVLAGVLAIDAGAQAPRGWTIDATGTAERITLTMERIT